uniref:5-formyltetrahydrofolate cyclo-ligase n=1 Tax=Panagrolaimus sp. JU765 TaxID=591449 RepID=A0AC34QHW9_9BILA
MEEIKMSKKLLRTKIANILKVLTENEIQRQSLNVENKILTSKYLKNYNRISIYVSTSGEVVTDGLVKEFLKQGKTVFIPRFEKGVKEMKMLQLKNLEEFENLDSTLWGIRQHKIENPDDSYDKTGPLDLILMPMVAVTLSGKRLGHGMGFYDKFITNHVEKFQTRPKLIGLALKEQIVADLPTTEFDVTLDEIVTSD